MRYATLDIKIRENQSWKQTKNKIDNCTQKSDKAMFSMFEKEIKEGLDVRKSLRQITSKDES